MPCDQFGHAKSDSEDQQYHPHKIQITELATLGGSESCRFSDARQMFANQSLRLLDLAMAAAYSKALGDAL